MYEEGRGYVIDGGGVMMGEWGGTLPSHCPVQLDVCCCTVGLNMSDSFFLCHTFYLSIPHLRAHIFSI